MYDAARHQAEYNDFNRATFFPFPPSCLEFGGHGTFAAMMLKRWNGLYVAVWQPECVKTTKKIIINAAPVKTMPFWISADLLKSQSLHQAEILKPYFTALCWLGLSYFSDIAWNQRVVFLQHRITNVLQTDLLVADGAEESTCRRREREKKYLLAWWEILFGLCN